MTPDQEIRRSDEVLEVEPDAWLAYNNAGGAGLVPYLIKSRAEDNTNLMTGDGPPAYDTDDWPHPLYAGSTVAAAIQDAVKNERQRLFDKLDDKICFYENLDRELSDVEYGRFKELLKLRQEFRKEVQS